MLSIPRRRPIVWALCAVLSAGLWALLLTGLLTGLLSGREAAGVGLMFASGWNLSLLPVHARPWAARRERRVVRTASAAHTETLDPEDPQDPES